MSGDGRLDLDDLGQVVENATPLDEVSAGREGPTWAERAAPLSAWSSRHRGALVAVVVTALVLGAGAAVRQVRQPPPAPTALAVSLSLPATRPEPLTYVGNGTFTVAVRATARREGETARVVGLVGPGIAASRSALVEPETFGVTAIVNCGLEPGLVSGPVPLQHHVAVETIDEHGRTLRGRLPLSGVTDAMGPQLADFCAHQVVTAGVGSEVTGARRDGDALELTVSIRNETEHRLGVTASPRSGTVDVSAPPVVLGPGRTRFWDVRLTLTDCAEPRLNEGAADRVGAGGAAGAEPAFEISLTLGGSAAASSYYQAPPSRPVALGAATPDWRAWVQDTCGGRSPVTARVVDAELAFPAPSAQDPGRLAVPVTLEVEWPTGGLTLDQAVDPWSAPEPRLVSPADPEAPWTWDTSSGPRTTRHELLWLVSCAGDLSPPQLVAVAVSPDGTRSPWRLTLNDGVLSDTLWRSCPGYLTSSESLVGWGWDVPDRRANPEG
jgi:hypothetical protein